MGKQNKYNNMKKRNSFHAFFILVVLIVFSISGFSQHGWTVVKYTNSTTAYATVTIDGQAAEPGDVLGAFVAGECRAFEAIVIDSGTAYSTLVINGETIETVTFKVWDNSNQTVLDAEYSTQTNPGNTIGYPPNFLPIAANYPGESFIDPRDGKVYKIVHIGDQWWMAENLNFETASGSWFYNDDPANEDIYGRLYDWNTAITDNHGNGEDICPSGWHLPSDDEWKTLENYLVDNGFGFEGSGADIGKSIASKILWNSSETIGDVGNDPETNNSSGMNIFPGGMWYLKYDHIGDMSIFWSSTSSTSSRAWSWSLYNNFNDFHRSDASQKINRQYVRCLKEVELNADFTADPLAGDYPLLVKFTDQSTGNPTSWSWDFNEDGVEDSNEQNPEWCFVAPGDYSVKLSVNDGVNSDVETKPDYIHVNDWTGNTLTDQRDSKVYKTILLGDQEWMAENLNYESTTGSWNYENNPINSNIYGRLYDWNTAVDDGHVNGEDICPEGWHMPSDDEWKQLELFLGMTQADVDGVDWRLTGDVGNKIKSATGWLNNGNGNNSSIFTGLPGGLRQANGSFIYQKEGGYFWSSSEHSTGHIWGRGLRSADNGVDRQNDYFPDQAYSVRCIKNIPHEEPILDLQLYSKSPVINKGTTGEWDADFVRPGSVIYEGGMYKMWYEGQSSSSRKIGYAESSDGITWLKHSGNPVFEDPTVAYEGDPCVVHDSEGYKMYYTAASASSDIYPIRLATSMDGINWTKYSDTPIFAQNPGNHWEAMRLGVRTIIYDGTEYKMFYDGKPSHSSISGGGIGLATSSDGINWTRYANNPIIPHGESGSFNEFESEMPFVVYDGTMYQMLFIGRKDDGGTRIRLPGYATSSDGENWNLHPNNPVLLDNGNITYIGPIILVNNIFQMWFRSEGEIYYSRTGGSEKPTITTTQISNITNNSAQSGGNVTVEGSSPITSRGVCWSTNTNPNIADNKTTDGTGTGSFTSSITGLSANTTYYVRAYATNNVGTGYGAEENFTTGVGTSDISLTLVSGALNGNSISPSLPELTVETGESITGSLNFDADNHYGNPGGIMPFAWTPAWGDHASSYIQISSSVPHNTTTNYNVSINQTAPSTPGTYYLWFIMSDKYNSGEMISCDRPAVWDDGDDIADMGETQYSQVVSTGEVDWTYNNSPRHEKAVRAVKIVVQSQFTFTDPRDGSTYEYVTIGDQTWMAENLAYLPEVNPRSVGSFYEPYYYVYGYEGTDVSAAKATDNYAIYGVLYNCKAATIECPSGWHLPSDEEWKTMEKYLGMDSSEADNKLWRNSGDVGKKLKSTSSLWINEGHGDNSSGFNALPSGYRHNEGSIGHIGDLVKFWSPIPGWSQLACGRNVSDNNDGVYREDRHHSSHGFSVRCVKNITNNDATLSNLKVDGTTVAGFDPSTLSYNYDLSCVASVVPTITVTTNDQNATFVINNASSLPGTTSIIVTAADGTTIQTYSINFVFTEKINKPDWTTPVGVQYSMTVHGQVTVFGRGLVISDCSLIAGFADGACLGVATIYNGPAGMQFQLAIGTNNDQTFPVSFKVYDYTADEVKTISEKHNFVNNSVINTIINPFLFHAGMIEQIIPLVHGWNWLSVNTLPEVPSLANVLENYPALDNDEIKTAPALGGAATYYGGVWYGLTTALPEFGIEPGINPGVMYLLNSQTTNPGNLSIMGYPVDVSVPIPIVENWNWLGYKPQTALDLATSLASLDSEDNDEIKTAPALGGAATYYGGVWYGLTTAIPEYGIEPGLNPGVGYLFNSSKVDELIYPSGSVSPPIIVDNDLDNKKSGINEIWKNPTGKLYTMVIHAKVLLSEGGFLEAPGSKLAAFKKNECRGVFEIFDGPSGKQFQLSVASDLENEADMIYMAYDASENKIYEITENLDFIFNTTLGKIQDPVYLSVGAVLGIDEYLNRGKSIEFNTYPNPFNDILNISFTNPVHQKVLVTLYDIKGQLIRIIEDRPYEQGNHLIEWNSNNLLNGVFYIRVQTYSFVRNKKVVKIK